MPGHSRGCEGVENHARSSRVYKSMKICSMVSQACKDATSTKVFQVLLGANAF